MQEKEIKEVLEMMVKQMEIMQEEIRVLNEKQNGKGNTQNDTGVPGEFRTDTDKQIPITGL